jgi:methionyl-tRNA synthetase
MTGTDAHESYVLLTAVLTGMEPTEVSTIYHASAAEALDGFDMHQAAFTDTGTGAAATEYFRHSGELTDFLLRRGRVEVRSVSMLRSAATGRTIVGPFAVGDCPACGAEAAGTCCEECGVWFGPEKLGGLRPRLPVDDRLERVDVPTAYLRMSPSFTSSAITARFPQRYAHLVDAYLALNGPYLPLSHQLGWGVPWQGLPELPAGVVHTSYALGTFASTRVLADGFHELTGHSDPFARDSSTITVLTSGLDAILPCMFLQGLTDDELDWQPFQKHVLNEFMLLDGEKFSTTRNHSITAQAYLATGLSPDLFRLYAALISVPGVPADFSVREFAQFCVDTAARRLDGLVRSSLDQSGAPERPGLAEAAAQDVIADQITAMNPDDPDVSAAARCVLRWLEIGESGTAAADPAEWARVLAWLAYPFMPAWASGLWAALGGCEAPSLAGFDVAATPDPARYLPITVPSVDRITALLATGELAAAR